MIYCDSEFGSFEALSPLALRLWQSLRILGPMTLTEFSKRTDTQIVSVLLAAVELKNHSLIIFEDNPSRTSPKRHLPKKRGCNAATLGAVS